MLLRGIWQMKLYLTSLHERLDLILLDAAPVCSYSCISSSPLDDRGTVYLSIKLLVARESYLVQKVSAAQTTRNT